MSSGGVFPVSDPTQVAVVRRAAQRLAEQFGFSDSRAGRLALVVTELGTNLTKHAQRGEMLLRGEDGTAGAGEIAIEVIAMDRGPGIGDVALSRRDGFSTSGTAGAGLGAIERQSDFFEIHSSASGTVMLARVAREAAPPPDSAHRLFAGAVQVNAPEELVCGDDWDALIDDARVAVMIADGLGHGLQAHDAARAARQAFTRLRDRSPADIVDAIHRDLTATRGAALGVFTADLERGVARYCGLGNVAATIVARDGTRRGLVSMPGTAGLGSPRLQEFQYPFTADAMLVMHSDGIAGTWDLASYPGLRLRHPSLVAAVLFRDFGRRRDDATAVVLKERPRA